MGWESLARDPDFQKLSADQQREALTRTKAPSKFIDDMLGSEETQARIASHNASAKKASEVADREISRINAPSIPTAASFLATGGIDQAPSLSQAAEDIRNAPENLTKAAFGPKAHFGFNTAEQNKALSDQRKKEEAAVSEEAAKHPKPAFEPPSDIISSLAYLISPSVYERLSEPVPGGNPEAPSVMSALQNASLGIVGPVQHAAMTNFEPSLRGGLGSPQQLRSMDRELARDPDFLRRGQPEVETETDISQEQRLPGDSAPTEKVESKPEAAKGAPDAAPIARAAGFGIGAGVRKAIEYAKNNRGKLISTALGGIAGGVVGTMVGAPIGLAGIGALGGIHAGRQIGGSAGKAMDVARAAANSEPVAAIGAGDPAVQGTPRGGRGRAPAGQEVVEVPAQNPQVAPTTATGIPEQAQIPNVRVGTPAPETPVEAPAPTTTGTTPAPLESMLAPEVRRGVSSSLPPQSVSVPAPAQAAVEPALANLLPEGAQVEAAPAFEPGAMDALLAEMRRREAESAASQQASLDAKNALDETEQMLKAATAEKARNKSVEPAIPDEMKRQMELAQTARDKEAARQAAHDAAQEVARKEGRPTKTREDVKAEMKAHAAFQPAYDAMIKAGYPKNTARKVGYDAVETARKAEENAKAGENLKGALESSVKPATEVAAAPAAPAEAPKERPGPTRKKGLRDLIERAVEFVEESPVQRLLNKATDSLEASAAQGLLDKATERIENERPRPMERPRAGTPTPLEAGRVYKVGDQLPDGKYVSDVDAKGRVSGVSKDKPTNNEKEIGGQVYGDDTSSKATVSDSIRPKTHEQSRARLSEQGQRALDRAENLIRTASDQYTKLLARIVGFGTSILHYGGSRAPERFSGYTYHPQGVKGSEQAVWVNDLRGAARRATSHKKFVDSVVETFRHELDEHTGGLVHGRGIKQDADGTYYVNSDGVKVYMSEDASEKGSTGAVARGREGHPDEFSTQVQSGVAKNSPELNNAAERLRTALMNTPEIYYDLKGGEEGTSDTARAGRRESAQYEKGVKMATDVGEEIGGRKLSGIVNPESYEGNIDGWWEHNQNLGFSEEQIAEALQEYSASKLDSELGGQEIPKAPVAEQYAKIREQTTRVPPTEDNVFRAGQASKEMGRLTYLAREAEGNAAKATQSVPKKDRGENLENLPATVKVDGRSRTYGAFKPAQDAAKDYAENHGIDYEPPRRYVEVDKERAKRIADEYEKMKHDPENPEVKAAYAAMIKETLDQYEAILKTGLKVEFIPAGKDPYPNPRAAIDDVVNNNHMWVFPTEGGFGTSEEFTATGNPLLAPTEHEISGKTATANDIFRVVHDYFGHIKEGVGFRASGEENAWRSHSAMYSPLARRAMTTETRGQNSWLNFGPHGEKNRTAKTADTVFADQKTGLLPEWVSEEGARDTDDYDIGGQRLESGKIDTVALLKSGESADPGSKTLREAFKELKGDDITDLPEDRQAKAIADKMLPEMRHQKKQVNSGIGWYKTDIEAMEHALKSPQPELNDSEEMLVMKMIAAATSFGQDPNTNIESALTIYRDFKESGQLAERQESGKSWPGKPGFGINAKKFTRMAQELGGMKAVAKWMAEKHPLSEIKEFNPNVKVQGKATDMQYGSYVLGPKGGPFFQNLIGNRDLVTGDRWDNRAMHRLMGTPISDKATLAQRTIFNKAAEIVAKKLDVDPADLQAMRWFFEKSVYEALGVKKASFGTYSVAGRRAVEGVPLKGGSLTARSQIQEESKSIATEVKFGTDSPYGRKYNWSSLTPEQQRKVTYAHGKYLIEAVEAASGVKVERADPGKGVYEGDANPNWVIKAKGTPQQIESASALFGLGSQQDSVIASREVGPGEGKVGLDVSSKTKGTDWARPDFIEKVWAEYKRIAPDLAANAGASLEFGDGGVSIRMFNDGFADKGTLTLAAAAMQNAIRSVDPKASPEVSPKEFQVNSYRNNWSESASGEAYRETLRARGFADAEIDRFIEGADASLGKAWRRVNPQDQNIGGQMAPGGPGRVRTSTKGTLESLENARRARKPVKGVLEYLVDKRPRIASPAKPRAPLEDLIKG